MIAHFDIITGEVIEDDNHDEPAATELDLAETPSLRLMTVQEAAATQRPVTRLPADMAMLPVDRVLAKWL